MRRVIIGVVLVIACFRSSATAEDTISYSAPADAKKERVENCAAALKNRCAAYGFAGVTAAVVGEEGGFKVEVTCKTGWTDAMRKVVNIFARVPCKKVELVLTRDLTSTERQQFEEDKKGTIEEVLAAAAPAGTRWGAVLVDPKDSREKSEEALKSVSKRLLVNGKSVPAPAPAKRSARNDTDKNGVIKMTDADWKKLGGTFEDTLQSFQVCWVADGDFVVAEHALSKISLSYAPDLLAVTKDDVRWLTSLIKNPLPFVLTPESKEPPDKK